MARNMSAAERAVAQGAAMAYPEPEFPIGHTHRNRFGETRTVVARRRTDQILTWEGNRLFSDESVKTVPWFYTLRDSTGLERSISQGGLRNEVRAQAERETDTPTRTERSLISPSQPGRMLTVGERLRSPHGTWTVARARRLYENSERGMGDQYCTYLLTHEDGHPEEWRARDMAAADFHLILPGQQTLI